MLDARPQLQPIVLGVVARLVEDDRLAPDAYRSKWRRVGRSEATAQWAGVPAYARSPRSTLGATRA